MNRKAESTIPISIAGWGVRESALVLAFFYAGLPESDGLLVSVLMGGAMFAVGILGGLVWRVGSDRVTDLGQTEQPETVLAGQADGTRNLT